MALAKRLEAPARLVFVGNVEAAKGIETALQVVRELVKMGFDLRFDIFGDGPERPEYEQASADLSLAGITSFHGWVSHDQVKESLGRAHFILLPSTSSEGWPKVLSEAMTFGVIPVASNISAIPQVLKDAGAGYALPAQNVAGFSAAIAETLKEPERWKAMSLAGIAAAPRFSYERYLVALDEMFRLYYGYSPMRAGVIEGMREKLSGPLK
jgi:glycosyltransferase involved in cell wall biosynthesis